MKTSIIFLFFPFISAGFSQSWNHTYNGTASSEDMANQVVIDNLGNVYVTGTGSGSFNDYVTIKYDISGMQQWVAYYKGFDPLLNNDDRATSIAVDDAGNVYVTGFSEKQTISDAFDIATVKYNSSGVQQWATRYDPLNVCSKAFSIAVDNFTGSVYVTGEIGAAGPSTCAQGDCITIKYNSGGVQQWVNIYNYNDGIDKGNQIAVDGGGNAYVTGESQSGNGLDYDYITIKYNLTGVQQWVSRYNGSGNGNDKSHSIAVDRYGNGVYVTGESVETGGKVAITSIKYDYSGLQEWIAHYLPPVNQFAVGTSIALFQRHCGGGALCWVWDAYITGYSSGQINNIDITTIKYNPTGNQVGLATYDDNVAHSRDEGNCIGVDAAGNAYVTGLTTTTQNEDYVTLWYDSDLNQYNKRTENGSGDGNDQSNSIAVDGAGNVHVTGFSWEGTTNNYDYRTVKYGVSWGDGASGTSSDLNGISLVSQSSGYAVGDNGILLRTTNGGANWLPRQSGTTRNLKSIAFIDASKGIAVGDSGTVLVTTNGGLDWLNRSINLPINLHSVKFINANTAAVVGGNGKIFRTTDAGNSWLLQPSGILSPLYGVSFPNANNGIAVGRDGKVIRTANGGITWTIVPSFTSRNLNAVCMVNSSEIFTTGDNGAVYYTSNGGTSWLNRSYSTSQNLKSMYFVNNIAGYVAGDSGLILFTSDKGVTWTIQSNNISTQISTITSYNLISNIAVGRQGRILIRTVGGMLGGGNSPIYIENQNAGLEKPAEFQLWQNYPNPFNPKTLIQYSIPHDGYVKMSILNILGEEVTTIVNEYKTAGTYTALFDAANFASGLYFYRISAGNFSETKKMVLMK